MSRNGFFVYVCLLRALHAIKRNKLDAAEMYLRQANSAI